MLVGTVALRAWGFRNEEMFQSLIGIHVGWNPGVQGQPGVQGRFNP